MPISLRHETIDRLERLRLRKFHHIVTFNETFNELISEMVNELSKDLAPKQLKEAASLMCQA